MIGQTLAHYQISVHLGTGGMGEVYRAHDTKLGRDVAVKVLPGNYASQPDRLERFEREARTLAALNHPNLLAIFDSGVHDGSPYLISELLEGQTLRDALHAGPLPPRKALEYAVQIAHGLAAAHDKGVVHRDLKPENLFITLDGRLKILDFGLAKLVQNSNPTGDSPTLAPSAPSLAHTTEPGIVLGTPGYMSPEQVRGETAEQRSDIFSFGAILYEMLSGRRAFQGNSAVEVMHSILKTDPSDLTECVQNLPPSLDRVVRRCLEKRPEQRFQTATDLAFAMENSISAGASAIGHRIERPPQFRIGRLLPWAMALGLAIYTSVLLRRSPVPATGIESRAAAPLRKIELSLPPTASRPVIAPDGKNLVYLDSDGVWLRWLDRVAPPVRLAGPREGQVVNAVVAAPFWSPQCNEVAYFEGNDLYRVPIMGGKSKLICTMDSHVTRTGADLVGGSWLADNRIVFTTGFTTGSGGIFQVPADGGKPTVAIPLAEGEQDFHNCTALPGGRGVLFVIHRNNEFPGVDTIAVWSAPDSKKILLRIPRSDFGHPTYCYSGHVVFRKTVGNAQEIWAFPFSLEKLERTGEPFRVADTGSAPSVADDGTLIYSIVRPSGFGPRQLAWLDRSGKITETIGPAMPGLSGMRLSPDERRIVAMSGPNQGTRDVWMIDTATGNTVPLTRTQEPESDPFWYPDGRRVMFTSRVGVITAWAVQSKLVDGFGDEEVVTSGWAREFSRSGKYLFIRYYPAPPAGAVGGSTSAVWAYIDLTSTERKLQRFPDTFVAEDVALSPDDRQLAYSSGGTGQSEIFVADFPAFDGRRRISRDGGSRMQWHPRGSELFWLTIGERRQLWSATISSLAAASLRQDPATQISDPKKVFDLPDSIGLDPAFPARTRLQITSDGARFLMAQEVSALPEVPGEQTQLKPNVVLVENWFEEFREKK